MYFELRWITNECSFNKPEELLPKVIASMFGCDSEFFDLILVKLCARVKGINVIKLFPLQRYLIVFLKEKKLSKNLIKLKIRHFS